MEFAIIIVVAFGAAMLTFFSGFGLGTILMPVFALFFPVEIAIALTAIVHLLNNLFKAMLVWRSVDLKVVLWFALPAALAAFGGATLLNTLSGQSPLFSYMVGNNEMKTTLLKLVVALLLIIFAFVEIDRRFEKIRLLQVGQIDLTRDDALRLAARAGRSGVDVTLVIDKDQAIRTEVANFMNSSTTFVKWSI